MGIFRSLLDWLFFCSSAYPMPAPLKVRIRVVLRHQNTSEYMNSSTLQNLTEAVNIFVRVDRFLSIQLTSFFAADLIFLFDWFTRLFVVVFCGQFKSIIFVWHILHPQSIKVCHHSICYWHFLWPTPSFCQGLPVSLSIALHRDCWCYEQL